MLLESSYCKPFPPRILFVNMILVNFHPGKAFEFIKFKTEWILTVPHLPCKMDMIIRSGTDQVMTQTFNKCKLSSCWSIFAYTLWLHPTELLRGKLLSGTFASKRSQHCKRWSNTGCVSKLVQEMGKHLWTPWRESCTCTCFNHRSIKRSKDDRGILLRCYDASTKLWSQTHTASLDFLRAYFPSTWAKQGNVKFSLASQDVSVTLTLESSWSWNNDSTFRFASNCKSSREAQQVQSVRLLYVFNSCLLSYFVLPSWTSFACWMMLSSFEMSLKHTRKNCKLEGCYVSYQISQTMALLARAGLGHRTLGIERTIKLSQSEPRLDRKLFLPAFWETLLGL